MSVTKKLFTVLLFGALFAFVGCGEDDELCDGKTCATDEILNAENCECVKIVEEDCVTVTNNITSDVTWTSDKCVILGGRITVEEGATLTIEPGTVIKGQAGQEANATAILIARGARLIADGTASLPIIFTSVADEITPEMVANGVFESPNLTPDVTGLWGGVIVLGRAPISAQNENDEDVAELQIEGIPTSDTNGLYGGNDAEDDSGVLNYISIRHGGTNIGAGNEINGLTLGGVGTGTTISNIEVVANADDGVEWFGGTVNATNVLVWNCTDDGLDTDQAWNGTCTNWIVALPQGGSALELDGPEGTYTQGPNQFRNGIIYCGNNIDHIIDLDDNTNSGISNTYFFGIDADYNANGEGAPIETFGGDGSGENAAWEYTIPSGVNPANIFTGVPVEALTEVSENGNSVGADSSVFGWTLGGQSGTLGSIGL